MLVYKDIIILIIVQSLSTIEGSQFMSSKLTINMEVKKL